VKFDLRSDTVTQPGPAMRAVMAEAPVGDDCYGDDPTVIALEEAVAELLGKPAAVFLPTGTMCNQLAIRVHTRPGSAVATHTTAHCRIHEDGSAAALSGAQIMPLGSRTGYSVRDLEDLCHEETCGWPRVRLVWLENTLGDAGGVPWPLRPVDVPVGLATDSMQTIGQWARDDARPVHLDGARLWNAHVATGHALSDLAAVADTVSVSMSKGLGAPMGSVLAGSKEHVAHVRSFKHALGGGLRQAGIVAAAGLHALRNNIERLAEDHARARKLAAALDDLPGIEVDEPATNMVIAKVRDPVDHAEQLCAPLREAGVLCYPNVYREVRLALHLGIDDDALQHVIRICRQTIPKTVQSLRA
jgi:threonine aldolase